MDRLFLYTLTLLLTGYVLGVIFSQKTISLLVWLIKKIKRFKLLEFILKWSDWILVLIALTVMSTVFIYFWPREGLLPRSDTVQLLIFLATFFTLFYSTVLRERAARYRNRGIIDLEFNQNDTDLFHITNMDILYRNRTIIASIPTYYARMRIINSGKETLNNVEVVIEKVSSRNPLQRPFLSLNLHWAFSTAGDSRVVRIPQGMSRIIDLFEFMNPTQTSTFVSTLGQTNNPDLIRYQTLSSGFRSCTTTPNTLSDIYPFGEYKFFLSISADNVRPIFAKISVRYNGRWSSTISTMRSRYLRARLISYSNERKYIF